MKTLIKNGRVVDPSQQLDAVMDILVEDGKIKALGKDIAEAADEVFDATGPLRPFWTGDRRHTVRLFWNKTDTCAEYYLLPGICGNGNFYTYPL